MLKTKVQEVKQWALGQAQKSQQAVEELNHRVKMLDLINSKCDAALKFYIEDGIKFADMQAEHLISRLAKVDSNSTLVWGLLNKHYGQDFFLHEIENEYGVSNSSSDKLQK